MKKLNNKIVLILSLFVFVISCKKEIKKPIEREETSRVKSLPYYNDPAFSPRWIKPESAELTDFHSIPDFKLVNQLGDTITNTVFDGKIYITDFFFTSCPSICPKMTTNLAKIQEVFKDDDSVLLLSHSVTPTLDNVPVLREYANIKGVIDSKWHLVTGDKEQIYDLGRNFYYVEENLGRNKTVDEFLHTDNFLLIDKNRHIRGIYSGLNNAAVQQLITDIKTLKKEL